MSEPTFPNPMPDSEELKAKYAEIAALKRSIEEKKMAQFYNHPIPFGSGPHRRQYTARGRGGGHLARKGGSSHRNMTLQFNQQVSDEANVAPVAHSSAASAPSYVSSITNSGMTLINSDIYEQDTKCREQRALAASNFKERIRQERQLRILQAKIQVKRGRTDSYDRVRVGDEVFAVTRGGSKLVLISPPSHKQEEKVITWNNLPYIRTESGDLTCHSSRGRINMEYCMYFTKTGMSPIPNPSPQLINTNKTPPIFWEPCLFQNFGGISGYCHKGSQCPYHHDPNRIRLCRLALTRGGCHNSNCLLSHNRTQHNTPLCRYYLQDKCSNPQCPFQHSKPDHFDDPDTEIWICRPFAVGGVCERGLRCPFLHLYVCPDFQEDGTCPRGKSCTLSHPVTPTTQKLILNHSTAESDDDVLVESENQERTPKKIIISSYTVAPDVLFSKPIDEKYDFYIDSNPGRAPLPETTDKNTFQQNNEFMIHLDSSDSELDDLEENNDYVELRDDDVLPHLGSADKERPIDEDEPTLDEKKSEGIEHEELEF
jgi:hypothetical protein